MTAPLQVSRFRYVGRKKSRTMHRVLLIVCLGAFVVVGVWELWRRSGIPPRWEDRLVGKWTGHSGVQSLAVIQGSGVIAAGFAGEDIEPRARVVCYDPETGRQK